MPRHRYLLPVLAALLIGSTWLSIVIFGKTAPLGFFEGDKQDIQVIAKRICDAATQIECTVTWSGKQRWFGTLQPQSAGQSKAGLDHVRKALDTGAWQITTQAGASLS